MLSSIFRPRGTRRPSHRDFGSLQEPAVADENHPLLGARDHIPAMRNDNDDDYNEPDDPHQAEDLHMHEDEDGDDDNVPLLPIFSAAHLGRHISFLMGQIVHPSLTRDRCHPCL